MDLTLGRLSSIASLLMLSEEKKTIPTRTAIEIMVDRVTSVVTNHRLQRPMSAATLNAHLQSVL